MTNPSGGNRGDARQNGDSGGEETPPSEWIVAGLSLLLVLGVIAFLLHDAFTTPSSPPEISVTVDSVIVGRTGYTAMITARNIGGQTAANVRISGELRPPGPGAGDSAAVERASVQFGFVPVGSVRSGGLFFARDPRRYHVVVRADGFTAP